jgi:pyridinium-3,5-bisthiocarboxylic acid mononucleotide nickel chelatase
MNAFYDGTAKIEKLVHRKNYSLMRQNIAYLDCHSGISGDMLLGALLDAGLSLAKLKEGLSMLPVEGYELKLEPFRDYGIVGSRFEVLLAEQEQPARSFTAIAALLQSSPLPNTVIERAIAIFRTLGEAEAVIHGMSLEDIHFHEVGAVDAIVDIVGTVIALDELGIVQLYASPLPLTHGHLRMAHGLLPIPAPATLEILSKVKAPWLPCPLEGELVTPTGAAILATLASFKTPAIAIDQIGYGYGKRHIIWPNCLRACIGEAYGYSSSNDDFMYRHHEHDHNFAHREWV